MSTRWSPGQAAAVSCLEAGLSVRQRYAVSHFRLPILKKRVAADRLAQVDGLIFAAGGRFPLAPSVFVQAVAPGTPVHAAVSSDPEQIAALFRCPLCGTEGLVQHDATTVGCPGCAAQYGRKEGVWDMKEPL